jgi:hypothetical protein
MRILHLQIEHCRQCPYLCEAIEKELRNGTHYCHIKYDHGIPRFVGTRSQIDYQPHVPDWYPLPQMEGKQ